MERVWQCRPAKRTLDAAEGLIRSDMAAPAAFGRHSHIDYCARSVSVELSPQNKPGESSVVMSGPPSNKAVRNTHDGLG